MIGLCFVIIITLLIVFAALQYRTGIEEESEDLKDNNKLNNK